MPRPARGPHPQPTACPTCGGDVTVAALACPTCATEVYGHFARCDFCALDADQRDLLRVFLRSRGNTKELERHLGVSYPTARARLESVLAELGLDAVPPVSPRQRRLDVLHALAEGEIGIEAAAARLDQ